MNIRPVSTHEERESVYRLRYDIYVEEMSRKQRYVDHNRRMIVDPLDSFAHVLAAWDRGKVAGTVRLNLMREGDVGEYSSLYEMDRLTDVERENGSITTRLMVTQSYRSSTLALRLAKRIYEVALEMGVTTDLIDCNPPLDNLFRRLGHRDFTELEHPEYGDVRVMKLNLLDLNYLQQIKSPFASILTNWNSKQRNQLPWT